MHTPESAIPKDVQLAVWRRDEFRCRECGVAVGGRHGCKPQTHHMVPKAVGGTDDPSNLITLCFPCHATKPSPGHLQLLAQMPPELLTDFIKHWTWDLGTNLLGAAEDMTPREFPVVAVLRNLRVWRQYLDLIINETERVFDEGRKHVTRGDFESVGGPSRGIDGVLIGVRRAWFADVTQQYLDDEIIEAKKKWREDLQQKR